MFIDFDNFFSGLLGSDPKAALELAERPSAWINRLATASGDDGRRWLVLRCYMNPSGSIAHPLQPGERLYFSKFRPFFTQAGVEVVDCPSLTRGAKNGADIRIVIDVMTALQHDTCYDEFVLASSDADFTPLLQVLRAHDRRTAIIATGSTAVAYEALADQYLDEQDLFDLMAPAQESEADVAEEAAAILEAHDFSGDTAPGGRSNDEEAWQEFCEVVRSYYESSKVPINCARLASRIHADLGEVVTRTRWFGGGTFRKAVERIGLPNLNFSSHHFWDSARHPAPEPVQPGPNDPPEVSAPLPPGITRFCDVAKMPRLPQQHWPVVFEVLSEYAGEFDFNLSEASKWSRDRARQLGVEVSRRALLYVIRGARTGGADLGADQTPDAPAIARAVFSSVLEQAALAGFSPSEDEKQDLADWLAVDVSSCRLVHGMQ
ncbi:NYN domain-containing protein [Kocuria flava]|uniref:NYN domain-containing protein n=1 Tax=Kocuria flava TaxID=446860 RepID=UPI001FF48977|nr:NYN domain-containing protein [Kocuria flava]MCJ8505272.1 NYN domain-containing protein [Kocuria flava]